MLAVEVLWGFFFLSCDDQHMSVGGKLSRDQGTMVTFLPCDFQSSPPPPLPCVDPPWSQSSEVNRHLTWELDTPKHKIRSYQPSQAFWARSGTSGKFHWLKQITGPTCDSMPEATTKEYDPEERWLIEVCPPSSCGARRRLNVMHLQARTIL